MSLHNESFNSAERVYSNPRRETVTLLWLMVAYQNNYVGVTKETRLKRRPQGMEERGDPKVVAVIL